MHSTAFKTKVRKQELLKTIITNRDEHKSQYDKAYKVFVEEYLKKLEECKIDVTKNNKKPELFINLKTPEQHLKDYNSIITMLGMSSEDEIEIDQNAFECYVMNKWPWADSFLSNTASYLGGR